MDRARSISGGSSGHRRSDIIFWIAKIHNHIQTGDLKDLDVVNGGNNLAEIPGVFNFVSPFIKAFEIQKGPPVLQNDSHDHSVTPAQMARATSARSKQAPYIEFLNSPNIHQRFSYIRMANARSFKNRKIFYKK
jgi:hypothetical protein